MVMFVFSQQRRQSLREAEHLLRMAEGKYDTRVVRCLVGTHGDLDDLEVPGTGFSFSLCRVFTNLSNYITAS